MEDAEFNMSLSKLRRRLVNKNPTTGTAVNTPDIGQNGDAFENLNLGKLTELPTDTKELDTVEETLLDNEIEEKECNEDSILETVVKFLFQVVRSLFDIKENVNRRSGFYRINPKSARKIHNDIVDEISGSESDDVTKSHEMGKQKIRSSSSRMSTESSKKRKLKMSAEQMLKVGRQKEMEIEKIILAICGAIILIGYPIVIYYKLMLF